MCGAVSASFPPLGKSVVSTYLDGTGCFKHNVGALQVHIYLQIYQSLSVKIGIYVYCQIGQLVAMFVVQGVSGIHGLINSVYSYLSGMPVSDIIVSIAEVPDPDVREMLEKVCH